MSEKKTLEELESQIEQLKQLHSQNGLDLSDEIAKLSEKLSDRQKTAKERLDGWDIVQLARHPDRPDGRAYIDALTDDFYPLHGDRLLGDDKALTGGLAKYDGQTVVIIAQSKGGNASESQETNFGMLKSEGYRKAQRLMDLAEKFDFPILSLIDTPGAYPGKEAEENNIGGMIAQCISRMITLNVPTIAAVIGEGGSGGAVAIGAADRVLMLENSIYSVISPEGCAAILWKNRDNADEAARGLKLTAANAKELGVVDEVIDEGPGAHKEFKIAADNLDRSLKKNLSELSQLNEEELLERRQKKYRQMGSFRRVTKDTERSEGS
ncbi:acetyl-CoA carboxylase carboxyltransferase subunit alpha [Candidatus Bipolaricaulota bacterium]|nr:acetyl-CoA carboxylase carboxyltransferase subunit alpha [Candidatus Bipolaricaulota bacterium]